jgi:hypothetical protein
MATLLSPTPPPFDTAIQQTDGTMPEIWRRWFALLGVQTIQQVITNTAAIARAPSSANTFTVATQPTKTVADAGFVGYLSDVGHFVTWTGTLWHFMPGDVGNGFFRPFAIVPQEVGWQLCDGTATSYLTVGGATLTLTAFTTPNLVASAAYWKSAATYSGAIAAASGSTATGTTGTGTTGTGTSGDEAAHTHGPGSFVTNRGDNIFDNVTGGAGITASDSTHTHVVSGTSAAGSAHHHSVPGLTVPGLSVPALGVGSIDPAHLNVLAYFRR